jgi:hypothetical protein
MALHSEGRYKEAEELEVQVMETRGRVHFVFKDVMLKVCLSY